MRTPEPESGQTASLETDLAGLQVQLMQTNSTEKREQLMDKFVEYERRLGLAWTKEDPGHGLPVQAVSSDETKILVIFDVHSDPKEAGISCDIESERTASRQ